MSSYRVGFSSVLYRPRTLGGSGSGADFPFAPRPGPPEVSFTRPTPVAAAVRTPSPAFRRNSLRRTYTGSGVTSREGGSGVSGLDMAASPRGHVPGLHWVTT